MRSILIVILLCVTCACQSPKNMVVGEWVVDRVALAQSLQKLKIIPPASTIAADLNEPISHWRFAFYPNRELAMNVNGLRLEGRYKVNRVVSNTLYIRAEVKPNYTSKLDTVLNVKSRASKAQTHRLSMRISGDQATLSLDNMRPMVLKRSSNQMFNP